MLSLKAAAASAAITDAVGAATIMATTMSAVQKMKTEAAGNIAKNAGQGASGASSSVGQI